MPRVCVISCWFSWKQCCPYCAIHLLAFSLVIVNHCRYKLNGNYQGVAKSQLLEQFINVPSTSVEPRRGAVVCCSPDRSNYKWVCPLRMEHWQQSLSNFCNSNWKCTLMIFPTYRLRSCLSTTFFLHFSKVYIQGFSISGTVTPYSNVKPLMHFTVYTFERCGFKIYQLNSFHRCTRSWGGMLSYLVALI